MYLRRLGSTSRTMSEDGLEPAPKLWIGCGAPVLTAQPFNSLDLNLKFNFKI